MKSASAVLFALAGVALAQNLDGQPACATSCLGSAIAKASCTDQACACASQAAIAADVAPCLIAACTNPSDLLAAQSAGSAACVKFSATATGGGGDDSSTETSKTSGPTITTAPTTTGTGSASGTETGSGSQITSGSESTPSGNPTGTDGGSSASGGDEPTGTSTEGPGSTNFAAVATPMAVGALAALVGLVGAL